MLRSLCWAVPALAVLAASLALAGDKKDKADNKKPAPAKGPAAGPLHYFDVDRFFEEYDRNKDGYLTRDELSESLRHNFDKIDANKDGKLSKEEVRRNAGWLQPRRRPSDTVYVLIEMSDCDEGCTEEVQRVYDVLRKLDTNKDGKIDPDEMKSMRHQLVKERVDFLFKELDADKDGKISRDEAKGEIRRNFDKIDHNRDGFIERKELMEAALEKQPPIPATPPAPGRKSSERRDRK